MKKTFMGVRLRVLREERGLTQSGLAKMLDISPSYLNQIERNQRPLTVPVLLRLNEVLGLDVQLFAEGDEARLVTDLRAALGDQGEAPGTAELRELAANMPGIARAIVVQQRRLREAVERADLLAERVSGGAGMPLPPTAFEAVRDWFYERRNYIGLLDEAAEAIGDGLPPGAMAEGLAARLAGRHGVKIRIDEDGTTLRRYDEGSRILHLAAHLSPGQRAFQIAVQLAFLEQETAIARLVADSGLDPEAAAQLRIGLASYFAGAVILPYRDFLDVAEARSYDIELIARHFGVGFETTCHRLSTLQRPGARGVPFFFIRVDRAGNISKRQSATDFHFSRFGGSCPLWKVYEAFARPGEVLTQLAEMPDGRRYLWIARTVEQGPGGYGAERKQFAVALDCDLAHAERLVYGRGIDIKADSAVTPIGPGCKLCERASCRQRAFPMIGRPLEQTTAQRSFAPYAVRPEA
ncbi:MAG: short-chain fatty acyl-CoA regulator family protein [Paracoccus sp. (in: a-proteobacteria)]|uniref:short-chain fatty acyl-CoA regulator family protein n=1 Tax=Paracoccus sp. TaxID=267 RepID=UPI0026DFB6E9|nr:short-chain fatty acyl-CoA regulator family protein [Paracoccus sp. (in: a-proteobacteria)]MDO5622889.1 short-chain fatty acyl-CoA regulator family protein [Paracoccus sp. (in: a-proteobacteria)]